MATYLKKRRIAAARTVPRTGEGPSRWRPDQTDLIIWPRKDCRDYKGCTGSLQHMGCRDYKDCRGSPQHMGCRDYKGCTV